ncbi:MAG TPA: hypothetical protein VF413_07590 [Cellulomonas sp.]
MTGFHRSVAFWLRAYPRRWRAVRAAEVTAVLADLAGPPPRRLDARAAAGFWFPLRTNLAVQMFMLPLLWGLHSPWPFDRRGLLGLGIWLALITVGLWRTARNAGRRLYLGRTNPPVPVTRSGDRTPRAAR